MREYYCFYVAEVDLPIGYVHRDTVMRIRQVPHYHRWNVNQFNLTLTLYGKNDTQRSTNVQNTLEALGELPVADPKVAPWQRLSTPIPVYSENGERLFRMEHAGTRTFGVTNYSVTLIAWTYVVGDRHYWVPKTSLNTNPGQNIFKSFVSVPLKVNEKPFKRMTDAMLEQTGLSWRYTAVEGVGTVSYHSLRSTYSQPQVQYVYEAKTDENDRHEIMSKGYELMAHWAIADALKAGKFEPDAEMAYLDHFIRNGFVTIDNEPNLVKIQSRLHRRLEWPGV